MFDRDLFEKRFADLPPERKRALLGEETSEPLRYAFANRRDSHAGSNRKRMVPGEAAQEMTRHAFDTPSTTPLRSAYIHIPFCRSHCLYCGFFNRLFDAGAMAGYIELLGKELRDWGRTPYVQAQPFTAVYFGGGTPTDLEPAQLQTLLQAIHECLPLANDVEITLEGRLDGFDDDRLRAALDGGVNRFSFGVQSFDPKVRRQIGRLSDGEEIVNHLHRVVDASQVPVDIDLIYGLPDQSRSVWESDVQAFIDSPAESASFYALKVREKSLLQEAVDAGKIGSCASVAEQAELYAAGRELVLQAGLMPVNFSSHWSKGTRDRCLYNNHAMGIDDVVPFGCGAGGHVGRLGMMQTRDLPEYEQAVREGGKPLAGAMQSPEESSSYGMIGQQLNRGWLDPTQIDRECGHGAHDIIDPICQGWVDKSLLQREGSRYVLTVAGEFWNVTMAQRLYDCLDLASADFNPAEHESGTEKTEM